MPLSPNTQGNAKEERIGRILDATLEVFSEFSFEDATTSDIANRARMSKRDLYAFFPNKQALLMGTIIREMQKQDASFRAILAQTEKIRGLREKLDAIGTAVVEDVLSPTMGVLRRLVASESIKQPFLGDLFFDGGVAQRCKLIGEVLARHLRRDSSMDKGELERAAERYFSILAYFPSMMTQIGMRDQWTDEAIRRHVSGETELFLQTHPAFSALV
jgi:TetR/AcrR family transcriptional repressor of mexJK operon